MDRYAAKEIVLKSSVISAEAKVLYMALDNYQRDGTECWPSQKTLMEYVRCSERSLRYYLAELIREGFCIKQRKEMGATNRYQLFHHRQPIADGPATDCRSHRQPVAGHKAILALKQNTPLTPQGGIDVLSLEGAYPGCTLCGQCRGRKVVGRSEKRLKPCSWCDGRGFLWGHPESAAATA